MVVSAGKVADLQSVGILSSLGEFAIHIGYKNSMREGEEGFI